MNHDRDKSGTLGPLSAELVRKLKKRGLSIFSLAQCIEIGCLSSNQASALLSGLVRRGIATRLTPGLYLLIEPGKESVLLSNWPVIANALAGKNKYFISHYSAMRLHGMTTHPLLQVFVTLTKRQTDKHVGELDYVTIYSKPKHFWGDQSIWVTKQDKVEVSDI